MRILHTSDWHLGRIFQNVHLTDDRSFVLDQITSIIREYDIDTVVVAGDIYDRAVPPPEAVRLLDDMLCMLLFDCKKQVIMISGNHDSPDRLSFGSRLFAHHGLHLYGAFQFPVMPLRIPDTHGDICFYPVPYAEPSIVRERTGNDDIREHHDAMNAVVKSLQLSAGRSERSIFCGHAFVQGGITQESERPICIGGSGAVDIAVFSQFNCTLLGHLHRPQWFSSASVHYSGSILPYSFSEVDHQKSVTIIDMDASGAFTYEYVPLTPQRAFRIIDGTINKILSDSSRDSSPDDYILVRLLDTEPILDAIGKLRSVYPNVLAIERPGLEALISEQNHTRIDHRKFSDEDLFAAFFSQMTGMPLSDTQIDFFKSVVQKVHSKEREVQP